ncbi:hypothetical protein VUR80DRAFT_10234 [Thermomyces stellatus]
MGGLKQAASPGVMQTEAPRSIKKAQLSRTGGRSWSRQRVARKVRSETLTGDVHPMPASIVWQREAIGKPCPDFFSCLQNSVHQYPLRIVEPGTCRSPYRQKSDRSATVSKLVKLPTRSLTTHDRMSPAVNGCPSSTRTGSSCRSLVAYTPPCLSSPCGTAC